VDQGLNLAAQPPLCGFNTSERLLHRPSKK
jgi:hypothetical protein